MRAALLFIAGMGCATGGSGAGEQLLASTRFVHQVEPGWHLRSLSLVPAGEAHRGECRPGETPLRLDLVYARADGSRAIPGSSIRCATKHSFMPVAVRQTPERGFVVAGSLNRPRAAPPHAGPQNEGLIPARVVREVPVQIPPALQVSERGR